MLLRELDYDLPEDLIAQAPLERRSASRMLVVDSALATGLEHTHVRTLPDQLEPSLFVVNQTRVLAARLRGKKSSGGRAEFLLIEPYSADADSAETSVGVRWLCLGTANKPLKAGQVVELGGEIRATIEARREGGVLLVCFTRSGAALSRAAFDGFVESQGEMPLPPYIQRSPDEADRSRYQTIFAAEPGAVAAPTAGLHFDDALVSALEERGHRFTAVTLHVGPGTFRPVQVDDLKDHAMHEERYVVPSESALRIEEAKREGRPIVAVGTTVVRTLEASALAARDGELLKVGEGRTDLFIQPGFQPRVVDHLLTNFHLPRSTLLALVMAFGGEAAIRHAYRAAVEARYRFFSYGDAMLVRSAP